jgi:hypothetical protein
MWRPVIADPDRVAHREAAEQNGRNGGGRNPRTGIRNLAVASGRLAIVRGIFEEVTQRALDLVVGYHLLEQHPI